MPNYEEIIYISAIEEQKLESEKTRKKTPLDYFSLAITTVGVGYLPLAPGTWGSMVGVGTRPRRRPYRFYGSSQVGRAPVLEHPLRPVDAEVRLSVALPRAVVRRRRVALVGRHHVGAVGPPTGRDVLRDQQDPPAEHVRPDVEQHLVPRPGLLLGEAPGAGVSRVRPGIETFLGNVPERLRGKRVGLITNHTGIDGSRRTDIDLIAQLEAVAGALPIIPVMLRIGFLTLALLVTVLTSAAGLTASAQADAPTADWELVHSAVHSAKELGKPVRVGPIVSSDLFYNPDDGQYERWSKRGILAVEMEAAALFTVGALRGVLTGCLLTVSDVVVAGELEYLSDDELQAAVDRMTRIALETATASAGGH